MQVLGTPTADELAVLNPRVPDSRFPPVRGQSWDRILPDIYHSPECMDLLSRLLVYKPADRITAVEVGCCRCISFSRRLSPPGLVTPQCLTHPYFDELVDPSTRLPDGSPLPPLFDFSEHGQCSAASSMFRLVMRR